MTDSQDATNFKKTTIAREYSEGMEVGVDREEDSNRWIVRAYNEGGHNCTEVDILDLVDWLRKNKPDLLQESPSDPAQ